MKILFFGDIVGRAGRDALVTLLPALRKKSGADFVVVNGDNAASGFGITALICDDLFKAGADVITGGNHVFDKKEIVPYIEKTPNLLRPLNYFDKTPGKGCGLYALPDGRRVFVMHVLTRLFMEPFLDDPFVILEKELETYKLSKNCAAIIVDVHGEATSEKKALALMMDGRVSFVVGSHTHVPSADAHILKKGTAYQTDAGMCGDYDSVIGFEKNLAMEKYTRKLKTKSVETASGEATVCGTFVETDDKTGLAVRIKSFMIGGLLGKDNVDAIC